MRIALWTVAACLLLGGCPHSDDPPLPDGPGGDIDAMIPPDAFTIDAPAIDAPPFNGPSIGGTFLLSIRAGFEAGNDPAFYVQFIALWNHQAGTPFLTGELMPLCTSAGCGGVRSQVPPSLAASEELIAEPGVFDQEVGGVLPGPANPFSGTDQSLVATLHATIQSGNLVCGTVTGTAAGLDLAGSTFAAVRVNDLDPQSLPAPVAACP